MGEAGGSALPRLRLSWDACGAPTHLQSGGIDECREEGGLEWMVTEKPFRVPLDSQNECRVWQLDGFDDPVRCGRRELERCREVGDGLVVIGIDADPSRAEDGGQQRLGADRDVVSGIGRRDPEFLLAMVQGVRQLVRDVLEERATECDVENLEAATDGEHGEICGEGEANERHFEVVAQVGDAIGFWVNSGGTVTLGCHVAATGEEEPVEEVEVGSRLDGRCEDDRDAAGGDDGFGVVEIEQQSISGTVRSWLLGDVRSDADQGCLHVACSLRSVAGEA